MLVCIATWTNYCLVHVAEEVEHDHMHPNVGVPLNIKVLNIPKSMIRVKM